MKPHLILLACAAFATSAIAQTSSYYLPPGVTNIRAMVTGGLPGPGNPSAAWQTFCATNRVGLAQLSTDLPAIATATGHPEIANAPLVLTGNSAASVSNQPSNVCTVTVTVARLLDWLIVTGSSPCFRSSEMPFVLPRCLF